jgi:hypothetical protein
MPLMDEPESGRDVSMPLMGGAGKSVSESPSMAPFVLDVFSMKSQLLTQPTKRGPRALIQAVKGMIAVSFLGACRSGLPNEIDYDPNGDAGDGGDVESGDAALFRVTVGVQMADATATETNPKGTPRDGRGV